MYLVNRFYWVLKYVQITYSATGDPRVTPKAVVRSIIVLFSGELKRESETNAQIHNAISQIQRSLNVSRPLSIQGGVYFEDALGREFNLPYDLFCDWEVS